MKLKNTLKIGAAVLATFALTSAAQAAFINGTIDIGAFGSNVTVDKTNNTVTFVDTSIVFPGNAIVGNGTGDFTGFLAEYATYSDFTYDVFTPVNPLWTLVLGGASFNLTSISSIDEAGAGLVLTGKGTIVAAGYDDTDGAWSFSADTSGTGSKFTFSSQTGTVPDGGTTVALLGCSMLGLGVIRRKLRKA